MQKEAVDANASAYWTRYFGDSGYGALWVRKIPQRLKAALSRSPHFKGASREPDIAPWGHAIKDDGVTVEGVARGFVAGEGGQPQRVAVAWAAKFDHRGVLQTFDAIPTP